MQWLIAVRPNSLSKHLVDLEILADGLTKRVCVNNAKYPSFMYQNALMGKIVVIYFIKDDVDMRRDQ